MRYEMASVTHIGNVRKTNQDSVLTCSGFINGKEAVLAIVADGMGGLSKGELASSLIVEELQRWWENFTECEGYTVAVSQGDVKVTIKDISDAVDNIIYDVHDKLIEIGNQDGTKLGTTLSLIILVNNKGLIKHIGDSRVYEIRGGKIRQLTKDQTYENMMIEKGQMAESEIDPRKNKALVNALGVSKKLYIETLGGVINANTLYLLASDGFYQGKENLPELFDWSSVTDLNIALEYMSGLILEDSAEDNLSGILVRAL